MIDHSAQRLEIARRMFSADMDVGAQLADLLNQFPEYSAQEIAEFRKSMTTRWRVILTTTLFNLVLSKVKGEEKEANIAEILGPKFQTEEMLFLSSIMVLGTLKIALDLDLVRLNTEKEPIPLVRPTIQA